MRKKRGGFTWRSKKSSMYDFDEELAETYKEVCECGAVIEVSTQEDKFPEYYTEVYVRCQCGKSVSFYLPVN